MASFGQSFTRTARLLTQYQFKQVFDRNQARASCRYALLLSLDAASNQSRLGLVVAKKHVRLAAQRNRIKRQVREYFRCHPLRDPRDLVFIARKGIADLSNEDIRTELDRLWIKLDKQLAKS